MIRDFIDENGLVHHLENPTEESSENELMFSALYIWLDYKNMSRLDFQMRQNMFNFYLNELKEKRHMSHDNRTGMITLLNDDTLPVYSLGNRFWLHPRDLVYWGFRKYQRTRLEPLFRSLLFIPSFFMILSCYQTYKTRNGNKVVKTDGKLLTWLRCNASNMDFTLKICTWLIKRNPKFGSWENVARIYFKEEGHPIPEKMKIWEDCHGA